MKRYLAGIGAGFIATLVLSVIMVLKASLGLLPNLNVPEMLAGMMGASPIAGWIAHFVIGTIFWGLLFVAVPHVTRSRNFLIKGTAFGVVAWVAMMLIIMPMAGAGLFGLGLGPAAPVMTLILHVVFGVVLGYSFFKLRPSGPTPPQSAVHA